MLNKEYKKKDNYSGKIFKSNNAKRFAYNRCFMVSYDQRYSSLKHLVLSSHQSFRELFS